MATVSTKFTGTALMVLDKENNSPIKIPLHAQETIMAPMVELKDWINKRMRTGGMGKMLPGGIITYYAYPKQIKGRDIEITYDDTTGKINGGMFGAAVDENGQSVIGQIKSTYGVSLVKDTLTLKSAKFLKHKLSNDDIQAEGLGTLVQLVLGDFVAETKEEALVDLKTAYVAAFGTTGKWATNAGFTPATTGTGKRVQAKTYTVDAAGGKAAIEDIKAVLKYKRAIGLKDGVEPTYPFARGTSLNSTLIELSSEVNEAILKAVEESANGFVAGVGINKEGAIITNITYNKMKVNVEIVDDMPQKGGKPFNWSVVEIGRHGAMALPNMFSNKSMVQNDPDSPLLYREVHAVGLLASLKFLQPELNFASFGA